jgi:hypothetical protein
MAETMRRSDCYQGAEKELSRPEVRIQIFSGPLLGEPKRPQIQSLSLKGGFWICSEASLGRVEKRC